MVRRSQFLVLTLTVSGQGMMLKNVKESLGSNSIFNPDFADYYDYEEPLPQGPTRPPVRKGSDSSDDRVVFPEEDYYYYYEDDLPQGPTRVPPTASAPVKEPSSPPKDLPLPSGPTRRPGQPTTLHPSLQSTTISPALNQFLSLPLLTTKRPRKLRLPGEAVQKNVLEEFGPFESHFIAPPQLNAGALPLAVNDNLPLFPPFNNPALLTDDEDDEDESS